MNNLATHLGEYRRRAGLSQTALAVRVGVSRQALHAIEAGRQVPSTALSLQLAAALGCRVEDLFQLTPQGFEVTLAPSAGQGARVALGCIDGRWVAHRLPPGDTTAADALLVVQAGDRTTVELLGPLEPLRSNVLIAGCAPLLGVLADALVRRRSGPRPIWIHANTREALHLLRAGLVHAAGVHLPDEQAGAGPDQVVVNLTRWRQGLVVPRGNPLGIRHPSDLARAGLKFAGREEGAGAAALVRRLVDVPLSGPVAPGHETVAQLVRYGAADAGIAIEAVATDLDFTPLSEERFDLVLPAGRAAEPAVSAVLDFLGGATFRAEASRIPGYDVSHSGEVA